MTAVTRQPLSQPHSLGRGRGRGRVTSARRWSRRAVAWRRYLRRRARTLQHRPLHAARLRSEKHRRPAAGASPLRPETVVLAPGGGVPGVLTSRTTWDVASKLNQAVAPVAVALDAARMGLAVRKDRGLGRHSARTGASIAGSWAGGYAGGVTGSHTGAALGVIGGPVGMVIGGLAGGLIGAVAGAIGLSKLSEKGVDKATELKDNWSRHSDTEKKCSKKQRRRRVRLKNELRRGLFRPMVDGDRKR